MNVVMIVPTGVGAEIGGHAGDANPAAKLLGSVCDNLLLHPNVVNASDINEMPDNAWYIEGSTLDRFLEGEFDLFRPAYNKILLCVNRLPNGTVPNEIVNAASGANYTIGADISVLGLNIPLKMKAYYNSANIATGDVEGWHELTQQVQDYDFDALAIASPIDIDKDDALKYVQHGGVNPWGGIEAKASKLIAERLNKPVAHAPYGHTLDDFNEITDPRMAAEFVSVCYIHCILKGLHRAPRINSGIYRQGLMSVNDIDLMVSPYGCFGRPHEACIDHNIPIMIVEENKTCCDHRPQEDFIMVKNYWEAAGYIAALQAGIRPDRARRPAMITVIN